MAKKTQAQIEFKAVTSEFTGGIKEVNSSLKTMQNELKLNSAQLKNNGEDTNLLAQRQQVLQRQYDATSQKIELTEKSLEEAKRVLGENSTEYRNLENALLRAKTAQQNIQNEINQTSRRLEDLESAANNAEDNIESLSRELDDLGDAANSTGSGFTTLRGAIATFAGNVLTNVISKAGELVGEIFNLSEETKEFRMNMAKLDGATEQYGYSTEYTSQKIKELYGYFQDEQVAVNTLSNLQGLKLSQDELTNTLNAGIAVWSAYGDSIPIEGLTESINETAQVGKITGSLADALNWAGISEDNFNLKLEKVNSTKERAKLITDTLNGAYGKSKQTYDENTESLRTNNEANMELIQKQAELGEAIEPINTVFTELKITVLEGITPAVQFLSEGITTLKSAFQSLPQGTQTTILAVAGITTAIVLLIGVVGVISSSLGVLASIWGVVTGVFSAGIAIFAGVGGAIAGLSAPVLIAVAAISTLIAIGVTLYKNSDTVKTNVVRIWTAITNTIANKIKGAVDIVKFGINVIKGLFNFKFSWPHLPLPHFSINPPGWKVGDLLQGSIPSLGIKWYAKGGIMTQPTLFGGGEAGPEAVLPLNGFYDYLDKKLSTLNNRSETIDYDRLTNSVVTGLKEVGIYMSDKQVGKLVAREVKNVNSSIDDRLNRLSGIK